MKRLLSIVLCALSIFMVLTGCSKNNMVTGDVSPSDDRIQIGFSFDTYVIERWERDRDIFISKANELGAEVNIQSANGDIEEQKRQIQYFIDKKVDVIVIVPVDCGALSEEVRKAHNAGIYVVSYDRLIENADVDLYITFDNQKVGTLMAESISEASSQPNVIVLNGPTTDSNVSQVYGGFSLVASEREFNILDETYIEGWEQELAYDYINSHMDIVAEADAIMCGNDALAGRVIQALSEHRMAGDICVVGQDADLDACQRIVEGTQYMTVYKPIVELAESAATYSINLAKGESIPMSGETFDGEYYVTYIAIKPYAVTTANMDDIVIDSGFHLREEVYLNVM